MYMYIYGELTPKDESLQRTEYKTQILNFTTRVVNTDDPTRMQSKSLLKYTIRGP